MRYGNWRNPHSVILKNHKNLTTTKSLLGSLSKIQANVMYENKYFWLLVYVMEIERLVLLSLVNET